MSRIYYRDGRVEIYPPGIAYQIWLVVPGTVLRAVGDCRPVMQWEFNVGVRRG